MTEIRKITPDPDDYRAIHEDEPDLKKDGRKPLNVARPSRTAVEPTERPRRSRTPANRLTGRYGLPRPITGHSSPTGEDQ